MTNFARVSLSQAAMSGRLDPDFHIAAQRLEDEHSPPKLALWVGFLTLHRPKGWTR